MTRTNNGDFAYGSTGNALLEFFSKAGSCFKKKDSYYGGEATAIDLFKSAWVTNNYKAMQLAMHLRDARGGSGNRSGFRDIIKWLAEKDAKWVEANLHLIPEVGRWDDLESLVNTSCEKNAFEFWVRAIQDGHQLAAKWAPREDKNKEIFGKMRKIAKMSPKEFRKLLVKNTNVVETIMCQKEWQDIDFSKVPSVAAARYNNAFKKHDPARYDQWKNALEKGVDEDGNEVKVNASVLFPHDVLRTLYADLSTDHGGFYDFTSGGRRGTTQYKDSKLANAQFAALPDYVGETNMRIMALCDFSGSMGTPVSGQIRAIDVSLGLGLYCSDRLGEKNPFYRQFIPFSYTSRLVSWKNETFSVAAQAHNDGWCGSTNIRSALNQILDAAKMFGATNDQIPNTLLILSDMQFDQGTHDNQTTVEAGLDAWEKAGYSRPNIVYWNLAAYSGAPATKAHKNVALVSGFSPSLLKSILGGEDFTPIAIMNRAIAKYKVVDPNNPDKVVEDTKPTTKSASKPKDDKYDDFDVDEPAKASMSRIKSGASKGNGRSKGTKKGKAQTRSKVKI